MNDARPPKPPPTPPYSPGSPPSRGRIALGAITGVAILVVIAIVAAVAMNRGGDTAGSGFDRSPTTASNVIVEPGPTTTVSPQVLDAAIDEAITFIEAERQRRFTTRPVVEALDESAFVERYNMALDEAVTDNPDAVESMNVVFRAFGIIGADEDIIDVERSFGAVGVLGFYDTKHNELVVRGTEITPFFRTVLVHELTHALDDQLVELYRPEYDDADDEIGFGLIAVAEGNARRVEAAYYDSMSRDDQRSADREQASLAAGIDFSGFTLAYLLLQFAPYIYGEEFVVALLDHGGEDAVDEALRNPPRTSEQVLDFDKYLANEPRVEVPAPPADGEVVEEGVVGQVAIEAILTPAVGESTASRAAAGWGGDWFVAWRNGPIECVRAAFVMETANDRRELADAFERWVRSHTGGAEVATDGDTLTLTSCSR